MWPHGQNKFCTECHKVFLCYSNLFLVPHWWYLEHQGLLGIHSMQSTKIRLLWGTNMVTAEWSLLSLWWNCLCVARKVSTLETELLATVYWSWNKCFYIKLFCQFWLNNNQYILWLFFWVFLCLLVFMCGGFWFFFPKISSKVCTLTAKKKSWNILELLLLST